MLSDQKSGLVDIIENFMYGLIELSRQPAGSFCQLETAQPNGAGGEMLLVGKDGSLCSVLEIRGTLRLNDEHSLIEMVEELATDLGPLFSGQGHHIQIVMRYDTESTRDEIERISTPRKVAAESIGMNGMVDIIDEWNDKIARFCSYEKVWVVLWTSTKAMSREENSVASKERQQKGKGMPFGQNGQDITPAARAMVDRHNATIKTLKEALNHANLLFYELSAHDAVYWMRRCIDPEFTSRQWRPLLPGDAIPKRVEDTIPSQYSDCSPFSYPRIAQQIIPRQPQDESAEWVRVGDKVYAPLVMSMGPQKTKAFNTLFQNLLKEGIPWQISFNLDGRGMSALGFKTTLVDIIAWGRKNKQLRQAVQELNELLDAGENVVSYQVSFMTWVNHREENWEDRLRERTSKLVGSVQGWGNCDVQSTVGDPWLGMSANIPAMMPSNPAPISAAPLPHAVRMFPFTRPASPWNEGNIILRTRDGKIFPYAQGSSKQASWIDIGVGPMGFSKSVWLNTMNLLFCLRPGLTELPPLGILDVGPSSSGLIDLLQASLPPSRSHEAIYVRLRNTQDYATNPADTPMGYRFPTIQQHFFLTNLLTLLTTPLGLEAPDYEAIPSLANACAKAVYQRFEDSESPIPYRRGLEPEIDQGVDDWDMEVDEQTTWFEVADFFFEKGQTYLCSLAHRQAMPTIADIAQVAKESNMTEIYGEQVCNEFWRRLIDSVELYPVIGSRTRLDVGDAKVIALDIDEVAPKGGEGANRQTAIMYMMGRQIVSGRFFFSEEDAKEAPMLYRSYHLERAEAMAKHDKRISFDEFHRASKNEAVRKQFIGDLETISRETRKWGIHIGIYSQTIPDIPDVIAELASSVYLLGATGPQMMDEAKEKFALDDPSYKALGRIRRPGPAGADMIAVYKTDEGWSTQLVTSTLGTKILWALDSSKENRFVRKKLYERLGVNETLTRLQRHYSGGVKSDLERLRNQQATGEVTQEASAEDLIVEQIVEDRASIF